MTNHVHLLVTPFTEYRLSHLMQDLGRKYVRYINHTYRRSGTLWEGRYKASLVDSGTYLLTCMRYIELNPVRAGLVQHPGGYRWSSYRRNGFGRSNQLIQPHLLYDKLGASDLARQRAYRELFTHHIDPTTLHDIREALNQELVLGREDFKDKIERTLERQARRGKSGRPKVEEVAVDYCVA